MPTYEYVCKKCGHEFDAVQSFSDDALTTCPECSGPLQKKFGSVGVVFKGSGFYRTDSREESRAKKSGAKAESGKSEGAKSDGAKSEGAKSDGGKTDGAKSDSGKSAGAAKSSKSSVEKSSEKS
jgi:putative FmdB family regulatory protein